MPDYRRARLENEGSAIRSREGREVEIVVTNIDCQAPRAGRRKSLLGASLAIAVAAVLSLSMTANARAADCMSATACYDAALWTQAVANDSTNRQTGSGRRLARTSSMPTSGDRRRHLHSTPETGTRLSGTRRSPMTMAASQSRTQGQLTNMRHRPSTTGTSRRTSSTGRSSSRSWARDLT
jgi:hypothetical protein